MFIDLSWNFIGNVGKQWKLISFREKPFPDWSSYWESERKYWNADKEDKSRVKLYFGENYEEKLFEESEKKYISSLEYYENWNNLMRVGETIQVIRYMENTIVLSKDWKGEISDHSDLQLYLKAELQFFIPKRYCCEMYQFGTVARSPLLPNEYGRVSHQLGSEKNKNETVSLDKKNKIIKISDAIFQIVN